MRIMWTTIDDPQTMFIDPGLCYQGVDIRSNCYIPAAFGGNPAARDYATQANQVALEAIADGEKPVTFRRTPMVRVDWLLSKHPESRHTLQYYGVIAANYRPNDADKGQQ